MNKFCLYILFALLSSVCVAQTSHMKFMGIEMGCSIDNFQAGLSQKNVKISPLNAYAPIGQRLFEGVFSGEQSQIIVWYNERTKEVYRAKAIVEREGTQTILSVLGQYERKLDTKYGIEKKEVDSFEDDHDNNLRSLHYNVDNGVIDLFILGEDYDYGKFRLHIDYHDNDSFAQKTADEMDDL